MHLSLAIVSLAFLKQKSPCTNTQSQILPHPYQNSGVSFTDNRVHRYIFSPEFYQHPYQNSGFFKFQILECVSFFTRILPASVQNSGAFKFYILECIGIFFHQNVRGRTKKDILKRKHILKEKHILKKKHI